MELPCQVAQNAHAAEDMAAFGDLAAIDNLARRAVAHAEQREPGGQILAG